MAEWIAARSQSELILLGLAVFFIGFCLPLFIKPPRAPMTRLPYVFANLGVILLGIASDSTDAWVFSMFERLGLGFGAFVAYIFAVVVLTGAIWGELALRRSLDCSGTRRFTLFAMVPLLQLYLVFAPSKAPPSEPKFPTVADFSPAAATAVFLTVAAALAALGQYYGPIARVEQVRTSPSDTTSMTDLAALAAKLRRDTEVLSAILPIEVEENLILTRAEAKGLVVRYEYFIDLAEISDDVLASYRSQLESWNVEYYCSGPQRSLLDHGGMVVEAYSDRGGSERLLLQTTKEVCR